jgi:hypothetical protein
MAQGKKLEEEVATRGQGGLEDRDRREGLTHRLWSGQQLRERQRIPVDAIVASHNDIGRQMATCHQQLVDPAFLASPSLDEAVRAWHHARGRRVWASAARGLRQYVRGAVRSLPARGRRLMAARM